MTAYNLGPVRFAGVSQVTAALGANDPQPGDKCSEGGVDYVFAYNSGNSQASVKLGMIATAVTGHSFTVSSVTDVDQLIGVVVHATIPTGNYGWLATRGYVQVLMGGNNSAAAGGLLSLGADGNFATRSLTFTVGNTAGKCMSAIASGGSGGVFLAVF